MRELKVAAAALAALLLTPLPAAAAEPEAQMQPVPARGADEGMGPFGTLVIRGATLIDGSGAPPMGPVDIVVEGNRIAEIRGAGTPGIPIESDHEQRAFDPGHDAIGRHVRSEQGSLRTEEVGKCEFRG